RAEERGRGGSRGRSDRERRVLLLDRGEPRVELVLEGVGYLRIERDVSASLHADEVRVGVARLGDALDGLFLALRRGRRRGSRGGIEIPRLEQHDLGHDRKILGRRLERGEPQEKERMDDEADRHRPPRPAANELLVDAKCGGGHRVASVFWRVAIARWVAPAPRASSRSFWTSV